jgi:hypothetical protein
MGEAWSNQLVSLLIISATGGFTGLFIYSPAPGPGNLITSIAPNAGTDPFGNHYPAGITQGFNTASQVEISGGSPATVSFPTNDAAFSLADPSMASAVVGSGPTRFGQLFLSGAQIPITGHRDIVQFALNSPNANGSSTANGLLVYVPTTGNDVISAFWDATGFNVPVCSQLTASDPSIIGTASSPAIAETWHDMRPLINSFVGTTANHYPPQYRKLADGNIQIAGNVTFPGVGGPNFNSITFATLPAAYRPTANVGQRWPVSLETNVTPVGTPNVAIDTGGNLQFHNLPGSGLLATIANISGIYPLDNTGVILS